MSDIKELISICKCSVVLTSNDHKDVYETVEDYFKDSDIDISNISEDVMKGMIEKDTIIELQCYVNTPIGFYISYHYDVDTLIKLMIKTIENER